MRPGAGGHGGPACGPGPGRTAWTGNRRPGLGPAGEEDPSRIFRQVNAESGPALVAIVTDRAPMLPNHRLAERQAQAHALGLGRVERLEEPTLVARRDSGAVVLDFDRQPT